MAAIPAVAKSTQRSARTGPVKAGKQAPLADVSMYLHRGFALAPALAEAAEKLQQARREIVQHKTAAAPVEPGVVMDVLALMESASSLLKALPLDGVMPDLRSRSGARSTYYRQRKQMLDRFRQVVADVEQAQSRLEPARVEEQSAEQTTAFIEKIRCEAEESLRRMIGSGELVRGDVLAERLGISMQAVSKALAARRMFCIEHKGVRYFPAWLADSRHDRRQIEKVSKALGDMPGSAKLAFFTVPRGSLADQTPLEALAAGKLALVLNAAQAFAQT
ncbi:hypothetical protein [Azohydromonas lata]|uniref:Uncharacterized protein n=1 Tax=Azohydromonas lata TaxID=45677 RepID=A0ABU5ICW4_9BURK|nr:hypothetical protein [Azohydromonas lata]MDZ5455808.1 hypothetical protein [Azohydromonas lata]